MTITEFVDKYNPWLVKSGENAGEVGVTQKVVDEKELSEFMKAHKLEVIDELNRREVI